MRGRFLAFGLRCDENRFLLYAQSLLSPSQSIPLSLSILVSIWGILSLFYLKGLGGITNIPFVLQEEFETWRVTNSLSCLAWITFAVGNHFRCTGAHFSNSKSIYIFPFWKFKIYLLFHVFWPGQKEKRIFYIPFNFSTNNNKKATF